MTLTDFIIPPWARWALAAALFAAGAVTGLIGGLHLGLKQYTDYVAQQSQATTRIVQGQVKTVHDIQIQYRDRIQKIYVQRDENEKRIPEIIPADVDRRLPLPNGFVRVLDAAWDGTAVGPAAGTDKEPSSVPPSVVAANESDNAASCQVWRTQALKWRDFYAGQQVNFNGKAGDWYEPGPNGIDTN